MKIHTSHSTAETEYGAADLETRMITWFRSLLSDLKIDRTTATVKHEYNNACILRALGKGRFLTSKHISLRYHYLRENLSSGEFVLVSNPTQEKLVDFLTKPLSV